MALPSAMLKLNVFSKKGSDGIGGKKPKSIASNASSSPRVTPYSSSTSLPESINYPSTSSHHGQAPLTGPYSYANSATGTSSSGNAGSYEHGHSRTHSDSNLQGNLQNLPPGAIQPAQQQQLKLVAPFMYSGGQAQPADRPVANGAAPGLKIKRSFTKLLSKETSESATDRSSSPSNRKRKENVGGSSSFFDEPKNNSTSKGWVMKQVTSIQGGMVKKVQKAMKGSSGSASNNSNGKAQPPRRVTSPVDPEIDDDDRSSISSDPSFVQAPFDDGADAPLPPSTSNAPLLPSNPYPTTVYLPRSHTNLHAFTLGSLTFPPSPHPLIYNPAQPCFPRSSNLSKRLPRLPTFRAHLAKTRVLDRLEAQGLTPAEDQSIEPFSWKDPKPEGEGLNPPHPPGEGEARKIGDAPGWSVGLETWTGRRVFKERMTVWEYDGEFVEELPGMPTTHLKTDLKLSGGVRALAGLVGPRPEPKAPLLEQERGKSLVIDESMLMDYLNEEFVTPPPVVPPQTLSPQSQHAQTITIVSPPATPSFQSIPSPRPLPAIPNSPSPVLTPPSVPHPSTFYSDHEEDEEKDIVTPPMPIRKLPPRPLPVPPSPPAHVTVREVESIEGPVVLTTATVFGDAASPRQQPQDLSHAQMARLSHISSGSQGASATVTSAPNMPFDPLDAEGVRLSVGSLAAVIANNNSHHESPQLASSRLRVLSMDSSSTGDVNEKRNSVSSIRVSTRETPMSPLSPKSPRHSAMSYSMNPSATSSTSSTHLLLPETGIFNSTLSTPLTLDAGDPFDVSIMEHGDKDKPLVLVVPSDSTIQTAEEPLVSPPSTSLKVDTMMVSPLPGSVSPASVNSATTSGQASQPLSPESLNGPVKVIKLKRNTNGQQDSPSSAKSLHKHLLQSGKFWSAMARGSGGAEKTEDVETGSQEEGTKRDSQPSMTSSNAPDVSKESLSTISTTFSKEAEEFPKSPPSQVHRRNMSLVGEYRRPSIDDGVRIPGGSQLPIASVFDVGRAYPTSKASGTEQIVAPTTRVSSSATREPVSPSNPRDVVSQMPITSRPSITRGRPNGHGHMRTPSTEAAARIEAHLNSVQATKSSKNSISSSRPSFLPFPGIDRNSSVSPRPLAPQPPQPSTSPPPPSTSPPPPPGPLSSALKRPGLPPSRWSEDAGAGVKPVRSLNDLSLPATNTLSFSASKTLPIGVGPAITCMSLNYIPGSSAPGGIGRSQSLFRPNGHTSQRNTRPLRM